MVFKYCVWPYEAKEDAKGLATRTSNGITLSERKFAESVLRCCPCVFRCRRAVGIGEDDQTTPVTATDNQPENITPVISLSINRSPNTVEKIITDENDHNGRSIRHITESIINQVQNTNNQLYQDQYPNQNQSNENELVNKNIINNNLGQEHDEAFENSDNSSISALEQDYTENKTINLTPTQTNPSSPDIPDYCARPANEHLNKSTKKVEKQDSSDYKLPVLSERTKLFNQSFGQRKCVKLTPEDITNVHSRLTKSANASSSKQETARPLKKTFNKSLPSIDNLKVPMLLYNDNFKRSESIESLTDESFVEKGSSSATEHYGNIDNELQESLVKNYESNDCDKDSCSLSSKSTVLELDCFFETSESVKSSCERISSHYQTRRRTLSKQSVVTDSVDYLNEIENNDQSEDSNTIEIVIEQSTKSHDATVPNDNETEIKTDSHAYEDYFDSNANDISNVPTNCQEEIGGGREDQSQSAEVIQVDDFFGHQLQHFERVQAEDTISDVVAEEAFEINESPEIQNEDFVLEKETENHAHQEGSDTEASKDEDNEFAKCQSDNCEGEHTDLKEDKSESHPDVDSISISNDEIKKEDQNNANESLKKLANKTPTKQSTVVKKQISKKSKINLQQCFTQLEHKDWEITIKGLNNLSQIARQEPEILDTWPPGTVSRLLGRHITNLRSQVARTACSVAADVLNCNIRVADQDLDDIIKPLLHRTADTNKFLRADSNAALDRIIDHFAPHRTISIIISRGATHQNAIIRATTGRLLYSMINRIGPTNIMSLPRDARNKYLNSSAKLLIDGNLNARKYAKDIFRQVMHCEGFRKALSDSVSESTLRHIDKTLKSL